MSAAVALQVREEAPAMDFDGPPPGGMVVLEDISWQQFRALEKVFGEVRYPRLTYFDGVLEIMAPPGREHETRNMTLVYLLEAYLREQGIRFYGHGSMRLRKTGRAGSEPDQSYCLETDKKTPDLLIEVIVTSGSIDKLNMYRVLKIPEVWFWKKGKLSVYGLQDREYAELSRSALLPDLDLALMQECAAMADQYDAVEHFRLALKKPA